MHRSLSGVGPRNNKNGILKRKELTKGKDMWATRSFSEIMTFFVMPTLVLSAAVEPSSEVRSALNHAGGNRSELETALGDLSPLISLPRVRRMNLSNNKIVDASPISAYMELEYLDISSNPAQGCLGPAVFQAKEDGKGLWESALAD